MRVLVKLFIQSTPPMRSRGNSVETAGGPFRGRRPARHWGRWARSEGLSSPGGRFPTPWPRHPDGNEMYDSNKTQ